MRVPALMRPGLPLESSLNVFLMSGSPLKRRAKSEFELSENSDESSTPRVFLSSVANEVKRVSYRSHSGTSQCTEE